jgi:hypothetical protein
VKDSELAAAAGRPPAIGEPSRLSRNPMSPISHASQHRIPHTPSCRGLLPVARCRAVAYPGIVQRPPSAARVGSASTRMMLLKVGACELIQVSCRGLPPPPPRHPRRRRPLLPRPLLRSPPPRRRRPLGGAAGERGGLRHGCGQRALLPVQVSIQVKAGLEEAELAAACLCSGEHPGFDLRSCFRCHARRSSGESGPPASIFGGAE